jgi:hypothetical protein
VAPEHAAPRDFGFKPTRLRRVRRQRLATAVVTFLTPLLVLFGGAALMNLVGKPPSLKTALGLSVMMTWLVLPLFGALRRPGAGTRAAKITVTDDHLEVAAQGGGTVERIPRTQVASGHVRHHPTPSVEIQTRGGDLLEIDVAHEAEAQRILDSIDLDADSRRATFTAESNGASVLGGIAASALMVAIAFAAGLPKKSAIAAIALLSPGVVGYWVSRLMPATTVTVGTDGVLVRRFGRNRLYSRADMKDAHADGDRLVLQMRDRQPVRVRLGALTARSAAARVREVLSLDAAVLPASAQLSLEAPSFAALRERLGRVLDDTDGYRGPVVLPDELVAIVSDPATPAAQRVAAAWALAMGKKGDEVARARVAVDQLAQPRLRILVNKALDDELDEGDLEEVEEQRRMESA